jgi:hypothetical protein
MKAPDTRMMLEYGPDSAALLLEFSKIELWTNEI